MTSIVGQDIGRYHVIEQLGQGGMATVYRAYDTRLEREVALKFIRREEIGPAYLDQLFKRFEREAKSLAQLSHPNIVKVYDYGEFEGVPYLVMEYLPGGTLKQRMGHPMAAADAARLLAPIARALAYAHHDNIIHRDVKPANILITRSGEPMLTDFGIAKILSGEGGVTLTGTGVGLGTPDYMAPEQWTNQVVPQTDIYALGIVFYEMVTGRRPFTADTPAAVLIKQMQDPLPRPQTLAPDLPDQAEQLLYKALAKDPHDRFATMELMAAALENLTRPADAGAQTRVAGREDLAAATRLARVAGAPATPPSGVSSPPSGSVKPPAGRPATEPAAPSPKETPSQAFVPTVVMPAQTAAAPAAPQAPSMAAKAPPMVPVWVWALAGVTLVAVVGLVALGALILPKIFPASPVASPIPTSALAQAAPTRAPDLSQPSPAVPATSAVLSIGSTRVAEKDGMTQAYVPAGPFLLGSDDAIARPDEKPRHITNLDDYWIDLTDVTNAMFQKFTAATAYETEAAKDGVGFAYVGGKWVDVQGADWLHPQGPSSDIANLSNHPVVQVTWTDALRYCQWAGRHLPTEAQWEKAARGRDGRPYPWGSGAPSVRMLNFNQENHGTTQVGMYIKGASPYGALDMAGNVWNWTLDWYDEQYYSGSPPVKNPLGPLNGQMRVLRGGSWFDGEERVRTTARYPLDPHSRGSNVGFRCASAP